MDGNLHAMNKQSDLRPYWRHNATILDKTIETQRY